MGMMCKVLQRETLSDKSVCLVDFSNFQARRDTNVHSLQFLCFKDTTLTYIHYNFNINIIQPVKKHIGLDLYIFLN